MEKKLTVRVGFEINQSSEKWCVAAVKHCRQCTM